MTRLVVHRRRLGLALSGVWLLLTCGVILLRADGCGWDYSTDHSVRFNIRDESEFARLPEIPADLQTDPDRMFSWGEDMEPSYDEEYEEATRLEKQIAGAWAAALAAQAAGDLQGLGAQLREYLELTRGVRETLDKQLQEHRNWATDKLDALSALAEGSPRAAVISYLQARTLFDSGLSPQEVKLALAACKTDPNLRDNAAYLEAAVFYQTRVNIGYVSFADVARDFPKSEKRETALLMSALTLLKEEKNSGGHSPLVNGLISAEAAKQIIKSFKRVMKEYPARRHYYDAWGWIAHTMLESGDRGGALAEYYRMLSSKNDLPRSEAVRSLKLVRRRATEQDLARAEQLISNEPDTALAYSYFEIYNFATWHLCGRSASLWSDGPCRASGKAELERIAAFANRMISRYGTSRAGPGFVLRVAQANLELQNNVEAVKFARRALSMGAKEHQRAEALWVEGEGERRLRHFDASRAALSTLLKENPGNRYTEGARRLLAMTLEDSGDLAGALDQYLALDYRRDVAYFVDVLMPIDQLAAFVKSREDSPVINELNYALAVRYVREHRWNDFRSTVAKIRALGLDVDDTYLERRNNYSRYDRDHSAPPKLIETDPKIRGVRQQWLQQDLSTANTIEQFEQRVTEAQGDEAKAEALYQLASYEYQGNLQVYNPALWGGLRHYFLADLLNRGPLRMPGEPAILLEYMQKHDQAACALPLFLDVAHRFPNTRAARDALYSAAVCHIRLRDYNQYWRQVYESGGRAGPMMVTFADVKQAYPDYRFPRGSTGWQPATRTVNGGPGWAPPPKKPPKVTRWRKLLNAYERTLLILKPIIEKITTDIRTFFGLLIGVGAAIVSTIYHMLCAGLAALGFWLCSPEAIRNVQLFCAGLSKCESRPRTSLYASERCLDLSASSSSMRGFLGRCARDEWVEKGKDAIYLLLQLDESGRSAFARAAVAGSTSMFFFLAFVIHLTQL